MKTGTTMVGPLDAFWSRQNNLSGTVYGQQVVDSLSVSRTLPVTSVLHDGIHSYEPKDYYKVWYKSRKNVPEKLINLKYIKMFGEALQGKVHPEEIDWEEKIRKYRYTGGYANFHLLRFSKGIYIDYFPTWGLYKDAPVSESIYEYFLQQGNDRYGQQKGIFQKERPYTLFLLQMVSEKDFKETLKYIQWASQSKTYTLFKTHPCPGNGTHYGIFWKQAERLGLLSEYTVLVDGYRSDEMIRQADRVVSVDSGGSFKAALYDIPTCTLRGPTMMTDIVPLVKTDDSILDVKKVPTKDKLKWLNWFYHRVCIDLHQPDYEEQLSRKLARYEAGETDYEVHKW